MKKICIAMPDFSGGGAEKIAINLAAYYASLPGYEVIVIALRSDGQYKELLTEKAKLFIINPSSGVSAIVAVKALLEKENPGSVISVVRSMNVVVGMACLFNKKTRVVFREANTMDAVISLPLHRRLKHLLLMKLAYFRADSVIANSSDTLEDIVSYNVVGREKCEVIGNPVLAKGYDRQIQEKVDHKWFRDKELKVVISVGRLHYQKNYDFLLRAFFEARKTTPEMRLIILGEGELLADLKDLSKSLGIDEYVDFPGFVNNPMGYISKSSLFVLSSRWEGFGNVLVEAMVTGVPIVSSNCRGGPKEILQNGVYGVLVETNDAILFAKEIVRVASLKESEESVLNRIEHAKKYEVDSIMRLYQEKIGL